ncbi:MAG: FMN-binding protein [Lachnospiraceae bacterium]|nr:FMN-binding protein [Lachnospiraceae bacterium]
MNIKKVFLFAAAILITAFVCFAVFALLLRPQSLEIGMVDLNTVADGEYIGVCQNKILIAVVRVCVQNHEITNIEVIEHKDSYMEQAEKIAGEVCAGQTLDVDAVSSATFTSDTVLKAIENALK